MNPILVAMIAMSPNGPRDISIEVSHGTTNLVFAGSTLRTTPSTVRNLTSLPVGSTKVWTWDESGRGTTSRYSAISLNGDRIDQVSAASDKIHLRYGSFDPVKGVLAVDPQLKASQGTRSFIVQFRTQPLEEYRQGVRDIGGEVENYLPDNAYVVLMSSEQADAVRSLPYVRWVGPLEPGWRLDESLIAGIRDGSLVEDNYYLQISGDSHAQKLRVAGQVQLLGGVVVDSPKEGTLMELRLRPEVLVAVAAIDGVLFIDRKGKPEPDMDNVRVVNGANTLQTVAGFQGQGVKAHVIDGGFLATHVDSAGRVTVRTNSADTSHGSSTTGIVWGNGTGNAAGKGMLPLAQGVFSVYSTNWSAAARLALTQDTVNVYNCVVESNSWGDSLTGSYTTISSYMDEICFKTDLLICNSMSNWGNNTSVRPQAWAKNVLSVGGVNHFNNSNTADDMWQSTGSIGPAADGRMKPELSFYYDSIFCPTNTSNNAYTTGFGGTSAATPMTAGCFGLLYQMYGNGIFGNSCLGSSIFANRCHASTAKAIMVANAKTYSNTQGDMERFRQGWGLANVQNIYDNRNSSFVVDESDLLSNLQTKSYSLYVAPGTPVFKATMAYTDYWASANANPTRVNQLSLKVTNPSGVVYYGNNGMLGLVDAPNVTTAGGVADALNNLQNVWINNPASGTWTVEVKAENLVQDGHTETAGVDADFGLCVIGVKAMISPATLAAYKPLCIVSGGLPEVLASDNTNVSLRTPLTAGAQQFVQSGVIITGTSPVLNPSSLSLLGEGQTNLSLIRLKVRYWNYQTNDWEDVSDIAAPLNVDGTTLASPVGGLSRFVNQGNGEVKAAVFFEKNNALPASAAWASSIDHTRWFVAP